MHMKGEDAVLSGIALMKMNWWQLLGMPKHLLLVKNKRLWILGPIPLPITILINFPTTRHSVVLHLLPGVQERRRMTQATLDTPHATDACLCSLSTALTGRVTPLRGTQGTASRTLDPLLFWF